MGALADSRALDDRDDVAVGLVGANDARAPNCRGRSSSSSNRLLLLDDEEDDFTLSILGFTADAADDSSLLSAFPYLLYI